MTLVCVKHASAKGQWGMLQPLKDLLRGDRLRPGGGPIGDQKHANRAFRDVLRMIGGPETCGFWSRRSCLHTWGSSAVARPHN